MYTHKIAFISLIIIGLAAVLMVVTAPTLENQQALAVSQPMVKKISAKDPVVKKVKVVKVSKKRVVKVSKKRVVILPKKRVVKRCIVRNGKRVCRIVVVRGPVGRPY
jgi:ribosomal protein S19